VLALDVGTTYSGVSYALLDPGAIPQIKGVTRFPAQETVGGDSKIPSILYYNQGGQLCAAGAEALQEAVVEQADEERWIKLEWWKLHLRPRALKSSQVDDSDIPQLPQNKSAVEVLGDFLKYLFECARTYIQDTHVSGKNLWNSIKNDIDFVLTHPNGWEGAQQSQIRRAAVLAGLIPDNQHGQSRVQFVTEGEASLHFCLGCGLTPDTVFYFVLRILAQHTN
jgi:molecular chaperone DnaK (HSP70)